MAVLRVVEGRVQVPPLQVGSKMDTQIENGKKPAIDLDDGGAIEGGLPES